MSYKTLLVRPATLSFPITHVLLNRPSKKNAISRSMYSEIELVLNNSNHNESCKAVVISGSGQYYSSGNDLSNFSSHIAHPKTVASMAGQLMETFVNSFITFNKPLICAVNGPAIGIPVTTMGMADSRVAYEGASFLTPFKTLAQAPEGCSTYTFPLLMGHAISNKMLYDAYKMDSKEALQHGFINHISTSPEATLTKAFDEANRLIELYGTAKPQLSLPTTPHPHYPHIDLPFDKTDPLYKWEGGSSRTKLIEILKQVNYTERMELEKAFVSKECLEALDQFLMSRNNKSAALLLRLVNRTRFLWDR